MKIVWLVSDDKLSEVRDKLFKEDLVARQSITIRGARSLDFNKDGTYIYINGSGNAIKKAKELVKGLVKDLDEDEENEVISRMESAEEDVATGFGGIFG